MTRDLAERLLDAALAHVPFDGWSQATLAHAARDIGADPDLAMACYPRAGVDLALAWHKRGDGDMLAALAHQDLSALRYGDRVALAIRLRLEGRDRELVQRGVTLFALPQNTPEGARAIWGTADAIWTALGDTSRDGNWYTKRMTLGGVYSASVLYWLGDQSPGQRETWAFVERRIADVLRVEQAKAWARKAPGLSLVMGLQDRLMAQIRAPMTCSGGASDTAAGAQDTAA
jgi:ubiquinone biosynthesis protein COQ9